MPSMQRRGFHRMAAATVAGAWLAPAAFAQQRVLLRAGDQKGGLHALLDAAGELKHLPYDIKWSEFPAAAPLAEALNAGAVDFRACSRSFHGARKAARSRNLGARRSPCWRPGQGGQRRAWPFAALPEGLPRKGSVCGVANPRRATSPAAVCALHPLPFRSNGHHEKTLNTLSGPSATRRCCSRWPQARA